MVPARLVSGVLIASALAAAGLSFSVRPGATQGVAPPAAKPEMLENCPGLVASRPPRVTPAAYRMAALAGDQLRVTYIGHSTFLIESPRLVRIATDYNDYVRPARAARHRHHEPRAFDAFHRLAGPGHQARAARLGTGSARRRRAMI